MSLRGAVRRLREHPALRGVLARQGGFEAGVAWNVASLGVLGLSGIAINLLIARWGGPEDLGVFNQAYAVFIFASQLAVGGVQFSVLHYVSHHALQPEECARISSAGAALSVLVALGVGGLVAAARGLAGMVLESPGVATALLVASPGLVFFSLNKVLLAAVNGVRQMRAFAVFQSLRFLFILAGVALILWLPVDGSLLAGAFTLAEGALLLLLVVYFELRVVPLRWRHVRRPWVRRHAAFGARSFLSGTLSEINTRVDVLTLGFFLSDAMVGIYSFAAIFAEGLNQLPYVVRNNLDPLFGNRFADGATGRIEGYARQVRRVFWPAMALVGAIAVAAYALLVKVFFSDTEFVGSGALFALLVAGVVLSSGYRPFAGVLLQGGRPTAYTWLVAAVVAVNLAGNLALIPVLGLYGAAVATSVALVAEAVLVALLARRLFGLRLY